MPIEFVAADFLRPLHLKHQYVKKDGKHNAYRLLVFTTVSGAESVVGTFCW